MVKGAAAQKVLLLQGLLSSQWPSRSMAHIAGHLSLLHAPGTSLDAASHLHVTACSCAQEVMKALLLLQGLRSS